MKEVLQIVEQMDRNIKVLQSSVEYSLSLTKAEVKEKYGTIKTYEECTNRERGALDVLVNLKKWMLTRIVNQ